MANYYKIIKNGIIVDVNSDFYKLSKKNMIPIECAPAEAQLIRASYSGEEFYRAPWTGPLPVGIRRFVYPMVDAVEISEEEFLKLSEALKENQQVSEIEPAEETPVIEEPEETEALPPRVLSYGELAEKVIALSAAYDSIVEQNKMLEECVLELSAQLYG